MNKPSSLNFGRLGSALGFGLLMPFVAFMAASTFERNGIWESVAAWLATAIYGAFVILWIVPRARARLLQQWPTVLALLAPFICLLPVMDNPLDGVPALVSGVVGSLISLWFLGRPSTALAGDAKAQEPSRSRIAPVNFWIGAVLVFAVAAILLVKVIPEVRAGLAPAATAERASGFLTVLAIVNLIGAPLLAWAAVSSARHVQVDVGLLGLWAGLSIVLALLFLAPAVAYLNKRPDIRTTAILLFVCVAAELVDVGLATANRLLTARPNASLA